jgi:WD40 repeat protein
MSRRPAGIVYLVVSCLGLASPPSSMAQHELRIIRSRACDALGMSPDGKSLAAADSYGSVRIYDVASGRQLRYFQKPGPAASVAFSPDGILLAVGGYTVSGGYADLRLLDATTMQEIRRFDFQNYNDAVTSVAFSPDGRRVAVGTIGWMVMVWDVNSGKRTLRFQGTCPVLSVAFSPDGKGVAYGSTSSNFDLVDLATGRASASLNERTTAVRGQRHENSIHGVAFSPDGKLLATCSADKSIRLWSVDTGKTVARCLGHSTEVNAVAFSPDGKLLASGGEDGTVRLWDPLTGKEGSGGMRHPSAVRAVLFSPDGQTLVTGASDGTIKFWERPAQR